MILSVTSFTPARNSMRGSGDMLRRWVMGGQVYAEEMFDEL
jgi:hypothetical protein